MENQAEPCQWEPWPAVLNTQLPRLTSYKDSRDSRKTSPSPFLLSMVSGTGCLPLGHTAGDPRKDNEKGSAEEAGGGEHKCSLAEHPLSLAGEGQPTQVQTESPCSSSQGNRAPCVCQGQTASEL